MKKDIEWLKKEIGTEMIELEPSRAEKWSDVKYQTLRSVAQKLDQLDEPEVLSQEWIDKHVTEVTYDVILDQTEIVYVDELENLIVPKQESPVVPAWFHEWWKDVPRGGGNLFHNIERFYNELYSSGTREACDYISGPDNKKKLLNIIINESGYKVEDEQKYYVVNNKNYFLLGKEKRHGFVFSTGGNSKLGNTDNISATFKLTEQEIKDYDSRYWTFAVKVEEVE